MSKLLRVVKFPCYFGLRYSNAETIKIYLISDGYLLHMKTENVVIRVNSRECKYRYRAFGLNIASDICFNELMPASGGCDMDIVCGAVPENISGAVVRSLGCQVSKNQLLFHVKGVGSYYAGCGSRIAVKPDINADEAAVRLYLLGTAFGALLLQRGMLPIHGSAVVIDGQCIIFTGASGAGKSTLSSAFRQMGYPFLADDISAVTFDDDGIPWVQPAYPQQKLRRDSCEAMGDDIRYLTPVDTDTGKYAVPIQNGFQNFPARLAAICELMPEDCRGAEMDRVFGAEKLSILMRNIYRARLITCFGKEAEYFKQCLNVAGSAAFYRLKRPPGIFLLEEQVRLIREKLGLAAVKAV